MANCLVGRHSLGNMETVPDNFLGLPAELSTYGPARFAVLPVPYDATTSYLPGTRHGPRSIITASQQVEHYDADLGRESVDAGITTVDPLLPLADPQAMHDAVEACASRIIDDGKFLMMLGGEHGVTGPAVRAAARAHSGLSVLQIDAHADLRDDYEGSRCSHACVMRRIHDAGLPFQGVGIRSYSLEEATFMTAHGITPVTARTTHDDPRWIETALAGLSKTVYVTIDIDGLDPAYAPGTGTPEPGGLNWFQVTDLLGAVAEQCTIVAADIVEVAPQGGTAVTEFLAARLAYRIIGLAQS